MKGAGGAGVSDGQLKAMFEEMCAELRGWRREHPGATLYEIGAEVTPRRQELMGALMGTLALREGVGYELEGARCERCDQALKYKGHAKRDIQHLEGEVELKRAYYHCPACGQGFSPPGWAIGIDEA